MREIAWLDLAHATNFTGCTTLRDQFRLNPAYTLPSLPHVRFMSYHEIQEYFLELDEERFMQSFMAMIATIEARLRLDYTKRISSGKPNDWLTTEFRRISQTQGNRARLDDDILDSWKTHNSVNARIFSQAKSLFKIRNWVAHGRYWPFQKYNWSNKFNEVKRLNIDLDAVGLTGA